MIRREGKMKKLFGRDKKPYQTWEEYEEEHCDWDDMEEIEDDEYYAEEAEDDEYYAEEVEEDGEYYAEEAEGEFYAEETEDGEYYAEDAEGDVEYYAEETEDGEYYAEEVEGDVEYYAEEAEDGEYYVEEVEGDVEYYAEEAEDGAYYAEEVEGDVEYYAEDAEGGEYYAEDEYYADDAEPDDMYYADEDDDDMVPFGRKSTGNSRKENVFVVLWNKFLNMGTMDRVVAVTGVAVVVMALITGGVYLGARAIDNQSSDFVSVGTQLEGIDMIGEQGLLAVTDAHLARIAAANAVEEEEEQKEYDENEYNKNVTVALELVSVQKDLKIKFTNKETNKLISNVPFTVTITDPDGKTSTWSDDDMDGIIYKKGITPGEYKVAVNALTDEKYDKYSLPTGTQSVEVKKDISYKKIDVTNEIKDESEVNAALEDTKKNETTVESKLEDTVTWVESTSTANTYIEVAKNTIPDPMTLVSKGTFMRMALTAGISSSSKTVAVGDTFTLTATFSGNGTTATNIKWSSSNPSVATVVGNGATATVTAHGAGSASISYTYDTTAVSDGNTASGTTGQAGGSCMVTVTEKKDAVGTVSVDKTSVALATGSQITVKATPAGFAADKTLAYTVVSNNTNVATATVDASGNIVIKGVAAGDANVTVSADYKDAPTGTPATATISVKVASELAMTLDKTAATVFLTNPVTINATIANAATDTAVTAESSDTNVATVVVDKRAVTITGVKEGSATITVKYVENGVEVKATCAVTVKGHPKDDNSSKLKDSSGQQLYVLENEVYREATYADYYTASKFFIKGDSRYTGWQTIDGKVYFFDASGKKVTGEQIIQGAKYNFASDGSLVTGSGVMGIDVSKWNGTIDWNAVKNSGVSYVIIRCGYRGSSQGTLIEDPKFKSNIRGATAAGLKVGVYFFTQAVDEVEAVEEASMVLELIQGYRISYPVFLDVESSGGRADSIDKATRTAVCKAFCQTIQNAGYTAGIYANKTWLDKKINTSELSSYKIWLAQYAASPTYTGRYDLWQYTSTGRVSGISGNVDLNLSYLGY